MFSHQYWTLDTSNIGAGKGGPFSMGNLSDWKRYGICILFVFSTEQRIIFSYCMPCMQVGLPPHWLSVPHIIDFFLRETGRTERDLCWEDNSRVGIGKSATVSTFCHSGALNTPPVVLRAFTASNLAVDTCHVCVCVCMYGYTWFYYIQILAIHLNLLYSCMCACIYLSLRFTFVHKVKIRL